MYGLKEHTGSPQESPAQPILAAKRRRQLHPFFFHMGPVALSICSVLLVALMAVFYLSQVGQAVAANQRLQDIHSQSATLVRQNQDLIDTIAHEMSPAYIAEQAKKLGLIPADPRFVQVLTVPHLQPAPANDPGTQP